MIPSLTAGDISAASRASRVLHIYMVARLCRMSLRLFTHSLNPHLKELAFVSDHRCNGPYEMIFRSL